MLHLASWVFLSTLLLRCLADSGAAFIGPTGITGNNVKLEQTWLIGDQKHFTWNTTWQAVNLNYQATDSEVQVTIAAYVTNDSFIWNVDVSKAQSPSNSEYFFFYLVDWSDPTRYTVSNLIRCIIDPANPTFPATTSTGTETTVVVTQTSSVSSFVTVTDTAASATTTLAISTTASNAATSFASSSSSVTTSPTAAISTPTGSQTNSTAVAVPPPSSLNTANKIALGVAIPLGVIALLGIGALTWWIRKRQHSRQQNPDKNLGRTPSTLHDMYKAELGTDTGVSEKPADDFDDNGVKRTRRGVSELSGLTRPSEMDATERDAMMIHEAPNTEVTDPERASLMRKSLLSGTTNWSPPISPGSEAFMRRSRLSGRTVSPPMSPRTDVSADSREGVNN